MDTDCVYEALIQYAPVNNRQTRSNWTPYNGPCCVRQGQARPDTRKRSGILHDANGRTSVSCFNCGFRTGWSPGMSLPNKLKTYLSWLGMPQENINKLDFKVWQMKKNWSGETFVAPKPVQSLSFSNKSLPNRARTIAAWLEEDCVDPNFLEVMVYLESRGDELWDVDNYFWTPDTTRNLNRRVIIPFWWEGDLVGWSCRTIDDKVMPRYYSEVQPHYIFNTQIQEPDWNYLFVNEGPFDGLAINGVSMLGDKVTAEQTQWLKDQRKEIIVVPDRTNQGGRLVDVAIANNWHVTFPSWDRDVKDAADAVKKYGRLYTVWSIIDSRTQDKLEINVKRQKFR